MYTMLDYEHFVRFLLYMSRYSKSTIKSINVSKIEQNKRICSRKGPAMKQQKAPDRRIQRTRQLLLDSLIQLILEKGYESITVQDIIDRANVGRSTFYSHFQDKEDLLLSGFESMRT